jgi:hypothetical protein
MSMTDALSALKSELQHHAVPQMVDFPRAAPCMKSNRNSGSEERHRVRSLIAAFEVGGACATGGEHFINSSSGGVCLRATIP